MDLKFYQKRPGLIGRLNKGVANKLALAGLSALLSTGAFAQTCVAGYNSATGGNAGQIDFTNASTGAPGYLTYWSFGDGSSSGLENPSHTYNADGYYEVCLVIYDSLQTCYDQFCDTITVTGTTQGSCQANFSYSSGQTVGEIIFANQSVVGNGPYYQWDFGDGSQSNIEHPVHEYFDDGVYNVCLSAYDTLTGCSNTYCENVYISGINADSSCLAYFSYDANGYDYVFTNGSFATPNAMYFWTMGDGTSYSGFDCSHQYAQDGYYTICLEVIDSVDNCSDYFCQTVLVNGNGSNVPCEAYYDWYEDSLSGVIYIIDFSQGSNVSYSWDMGDGTVINSEYFIYTYQQEGVYLICLTISDGDSCVATFCDSLYVIGKANGFTVSHQNPAAQIVENVALIKSLYPNPVDQFASVALSAAVAGTVEVEVLDILGKVKSSSVYNVVPGQKIELNLSSLATGLYILNIESSNGLKQTVQFVKK